jgi:antitoxin (DNA-binding transcriptional repressor) of toxin-antitoxin stability system
MKTMEVPVGQKQLQAAIRRGEEETIVLTRRGKPVAAVVPMKGVDAETLRLSTSRRFMNILRRSFRQLDAGKGISLAEMKKRVP